MQLERTQRAKTLAIAAIVAGVFMLFVTRVFLFGAPDEDLRTCEFHEIYAELSFEQMRSLYHFTLEQLVEERMYLYEGHTLLACHEDDLSNVIPAGEKATEVVSALAGEGSAFKTAEAFAYHDYELLLTEFWRTYDCHLFAIASNPTELIHAFTTEEEREEKKEIRLSAIQSTADLQIARERIRARTALDRLLYSLRSSEQYLPLHASLRCLQRGSIDVRNAMALMSDASQCVPLRVGSPNTSLLK